MKKLRVTDYLSLLGLFVKIKCVVSVLISLVADGLSLGVTTIKLILEQRHEVRYLYTVFNNQKLKHMTLP